MFKVSLVIAGAFVISLALILAAIVATTPSYVGSWHYSNGTTITVTER